MEKLAAWSKQYPVLGAACEAKERFHDICSHTSKADAMQAAEEWEHPFQTMWPAPFGTLRSWRTEVRNHYDCPVSNAYAESLNNLAKGMNRMGRGDSFDVVRARLLFDDEARADARTTIRKTPRKATPSTPSMGGMGRTMPSYDRLFGLEAEETVIEYGPCIPTPARKLEAGEFA